MIPSEIEIEIYAKRFPRGTLGSKGLRHLCQYLLQNTRVYSEKGSLEKLLTLLVSKNVARLLKIFFFCYRGQPKIYAVLSKVSPFLSL